MQMLNVDISLLDLKFASCLGKVLVRDPVMLVAGR